MFFCKLQYFEDSGLRLITQRLCSAITYTDNAAIPAKGRGEGPEGTLLIYDH